MPPIDYSKWDNIDTDSEPEELPRPKAPPAPAPTANPPQASATASRTAAPESTAAGSASEPVQAVKIPCKAEGHWFSPTTIPADHPIFWNVVPPIPQLIDVPLVFHRVGTRSARREDLDNQMATYLNIDAGSGLAPPSWQSHVGTVIVARKDRKPLLKQHVEGVWMYCDRILDLFGDGDGSPPARLYNREAFKRWWDNYDKTEKMNGRAEWQEAIKSPHDV